MLGSRDRRLGDGECNWCSNAAVLPICLRWECVEAEAAVEADCEAFDVFVGDVGAVLLIFIEDFLITSTDG
jgi:hypothetical protein